MHSSAVNNGRILLIGGEVGTQVEDTTSTEWIPVDGSPSQPGPFQVRHGSRHCTVQVSSDIIVVTGGYQTEEYVTEYRLTGDESNETLLTSMGQGRYYHACGLYKGAGGEQVRRRVCNYTCT